MPSSLNYIDLFAGCGGISVGLQQAGWQGVFAVERNASAFSTLKFNLIDNKKHFSWPTWLPVQNWSIQELLGENAQHLLKLHGKVDLIVGGPPCQGFSTAGRRQKADDRNHLIYDYLDFVHLVQPSAIIFENVRGFTMKFKAGDKETTYSQMVIQKLRDLGYDDVHGEVIDVSDYGVPQRRRRFILIATRYNLAGQIFSKLDSMRRGFLAYKQISIKNSVGDALSDIQKCHGITPCPDSRQFFSGVASKPATKLQEHFCTDVTGGYVPDSHRFVNHTEPVEIVFKKLLDGAPRNQCITGDERDAYGLKKRGVTVLSPNEPAPTITTIPDDFIHYSEPRVLTVRECARLQSFPDWFEFKGPYTTGGKKRVLQTPRYTQVGNAVPPLFAELLGMAAKEVLHNA